MITPHKHAEVIKAWADGKTIEMLTNEHGWQVSSSIATSMEELKAPLPSSRP